MPHQVLSHNLYTVLCIPHDPVALEEHFRDDDDGPVSSQGYMPYLNKYILDKVSCVPPLFAGQGREFGEQGGVGGGQVGSWRCFSVFPWLKSTFVSCGAAQCLFPPGT